MKAYVAGGRRRINPRAAVPGGSACRECAGPFGLCVADRNSACSNCIYAGNEQSCEYGSWGDLDSIDEDDYMPPRMGDSSTEHVHVPPRRQRAGRKRSSPDSDSDADPDFVPPKRRTASGSEDGHNYVHPKTRSAGQTPREAKEESPSSDRQNRPTAESESDGWEVCEVIDLTGENEW